MISTTWVKPIELQNAVTRRRTWRGVIGDTVDVDEDDNEALRAVASEARDCGAIERTGSFLVSSQASQLCSRNVNTSVWD